MVKIGRIERTFSPGSQEDLEQKAQGGSNYFIVVDWLVGWLGRLHAPGGGA